MEELLRRWDGESVIIHLDRPTGAWTVIAVHSTALGPARGGTRMKAYPRIEDAVADALNLATSMTRKFALAEMPSGGGKAVISVSPDFEPSDRPALLRRYGALIKRLGGLYETGPDVGTTPADMDSIVGRTIKTTLRHAFDMADAQGISTDLAARRLAQERLARSMHR